MRTVSRALPRRTRVKVSHQIAARGSEFPRVSSASSVLMRDRSRRRRSASARRCSPTQLSRQPESGDAGIAKQLSVRSTDAAARANGRCNGKDNR
jgi:hypothetical protein